MEPSTRPVPGQTVLSRRALSSLVIIELESGRYYSLDGAGARIWELIDGARTSEEIAAAIASEFLIGSDVARADVSDFLDTLQRERLLEAA
jgi:hypothetical protein